MNRICVLPVPGRAQGELILGNVSSSCLFWSSCEVRKRVTVLVLCELWLLIVVHSWKCRTPQSLVAGLMWLGVKDEMYVMRHFCENSDDLSSFGWREHNGRDFGRQELVENDMILETSFVKSKGDGSSGYGGDWSVRIDVKNKGYIAYFFTSVFCFLYCTVD